MNGMGIAQPPKYNFTKSEGKVRFGHFFRKWSSWRAERNATKQNGLSFQEVVQKRKMVIKIEFTPLSITLQTATFFHLKRVFKKEWQIKIAHEKGLHFMRNPKLAHTLVDWSTHRPDKDAFKEKMIRCTAWELPKPLKYSYSADLLDLHLL